LFHVAGKIRVASSHFSYTTFAFVRHLNARLFPSSCTSNELSIPLLTNEICYSSFYEGPSHHSLKAFCATPMMMIDGWAVFYQFLQLMEHQWDEIDRGKPTTRRKTCS
jgi:hypothetical protein